MQNCWWLEYTVCGNSYFLNTQCLVMFCENLDISLELLFHVHYLRCPCLKYFYGMLCPRSYLPFRRIRHVFPILVAMMIAFLRGGCTVCSHAMKTLADSNMRSEFHVRIPQGFHCYSRQVRNLLRFLQDVNSYSRQEFN